MDNKDYEEIEELEPVDEELEQTVSINDYDGLEEIPSEEEYIKSDFNSNNLQNKIRQIKNNNRNNKNTINRLNQRKSNTMSKGVEAQKSTPSTSNITKDLMDKAGSKLNPLNKTGGSGLAKEAGKNAGKAAGKAASAAGKAAAQGAKSALSALVTNPYFWIVVGVILLIMLIPVLWGAYDSDESGSESGGNGITYIEGYNSCDSITVEGSGTYPLEDYVAGVIEHEAYTDENIEALKAQAVAARTYAINATNNCTTTIGNSQASQTFSENPSAIAREAATATAGQVLIYNGSVFSAMYDSFCYEDDDCPDSVKNEETGVYTVTYTKKPNNETHKITLSQEKQYGRIVKAKGHASGMSQLVSYQMASEGKKYDEILYYFYSSGVKISSITKSNASSLLGDFNGNFTVRSTKPNWLSVPDSNYYLKQGSNNFQCVWYAKYRTNEIISTITGDVDETKREKAKSTLLASSAHGSGWYDIAQNGGMMSIFESSDDYLKPRPGAMVSYKWTTSGCINYHGVNCDSNHYNYGHVAVIESVDYEKQKVIVTDGWMQCENWNNRGCLGFAHRELTFEQMKNFGGNRYIFLGYVYVADYALNSTIRTAGNSDVSIDVNNSGSASNGKANTCSNGKVDTSQPDPAIAINYWQSQGTISSSNFVYPTDKETGYKLGAHPKNFNYSNLVNPKLYYNKLIWPVTPSNGKYYFGYQHNGIDVSANFGTPIYALGDGKLIYSEWGHTVNKGCDETAYSVTMELNEPVTINGKKVKTIFITHMSGIVYYCPTGNCNKTIRKGELLGFIGHASGTAAATGTWAPHLHMSLYDTDYNAGLKTNEIESIYNISSGKDIVAGG